MQNKFHKYENIIKSLLTRGSIDKCLLNPLINKYLNNEVRLTIANSPNNINLFFEEFDKINDNNKYDEFIEATSEWSEWIKLFLGDSKEAEKHQENFDLIFKILSVQFEDHLNSLILDEAVLHRSKSLELLNELQYSEMTAYMKNYGEANAKLKFLLIIQCASVDWYGKLLWVFYKNKCNFISEFLPDLEAKLDPIESEEEKRNIIMAFAKSIIDANRKDSTETSTECHYSLPEDTEETTMTASSTAECGVDYLRDSEEQLEMTFQMMSLQFKDHLSSLKMDESTLFQCKSIGLFTDEQFGKMRKCLIDEGIENAKSKFLLLIRNTGEDWYGKLLWVYYKTKSNFICDFLPELDKDLSEIHSDEEIKNYIFAYGNSLVVKNISDGKRKTNDIKKVEDMDTDCTQTNTKTNTHMEYDSALPKHIDDLANTKTKTQMEFDSRFPQHCPGQTNTSSNNVSTNDESKSDFESDEDLDENDNMTFDSLFGQLRNKSVVELLNFTQVDNKETAKTGQDLKIRNYQEELARQGIKGKNVLICSPTGSGKTVVAVKIVEEHLRLNPNGKVAFLVHRIALVEQQYNQFRKYLDKKITRLSGSAKTSSTPLKGHLKSFDIFILTSDILRNALEEENETKLESLSVFTLILFDECHNCDKKHPYNRIMTHYFKEKKMKKTVPQIIGLTASTGTNKARTMDKALKRLYTLCANLDTYIVSTVKEFKEELDKNQSKPDENIITAPLRDSDAFDTELQSQMAFCERMLQEMNARDYFPKDSKTQFMFNIPEDRLHQKYLGFVGKLHTELYNVTSEENEGRKALFTISNYLNAFVRALMVNHLFRAMDAVKLIQDLLNTKSENPATCKVERILKKKLDRFGQFESKECSKNPSLEKLKESIEEQIKDDPQSRVIVFVRERNYTQILKNIFSSESSSIKCEAVVGNTISAEQGGLTQNEMEEVLGRFRKGEVKVLFSTTVAEEGLDIQKCNLVIRYGHVTNETAMVQSRGRARAANSKYIVIVPYKLQWQVNKENINKYRESMMYRAISKFQEMDESSIRFEIEECQSERELQETCERFGKQSISSKSGTSSIWTFFCKKCMTEICKSNDIRLAEDAHHIVINVDCFRSMAVEASKNHNCCQIKCKKCSNQLGNRQNYKSRLFPTLKIGSFSLLCEGENQSRSFKKWRDVPFTVRKCETQELLNFKQNHELAV